MTMTVKTNILSCHPNFDLYFVIITAPTGTIRNLNAKVVNATSVLLEWDDVPEMEKHGNITHYVIHLFQHAHPWEETFLEDEQGNSTVIKSIDVSFVLRPLQNDTVFTISVTPFTTKGPGPNSRSITIRTKENGRSL